MMEIIKADKFKSEIVQRFKRNAWTTLLSNMYEKLSDYDAE